jgi:hypothetical protein
MSRRQEKSRPNRPWWAGLDRTPRWYEILIALGFCGTFAVVGVGLLTAAVRQGIDSETTEGVVVAFETHTDREDRRTYAAVVEYRVAEKPYRCVGIASSPPLHVRGQKVQVLYKKQQPDVGYIDSFWDRWLGGVCFTVIGLPLFALAIFSLFFSRMFYRWQNRPARAEKVDAEKY